MSEPNTLRRVETTADLDDLLALSAERPVMLLKHSTRCPVSTWAHREFVEYVTDAVERDVECAMVLVVEHRPVSLEIADRLGVRHQSPQAILIRGGAAEWNDSHEGVTKSALEAAEGAGSGAD